MLCDKSFLICIFPFVTEEIVPCVLSYWCYFPWPSSVLLSEGVKLDMRRSRCSILFLVTPYNYISSFEYWEVFSSLLPNFCVCLFLRQWYHISSFSNEDDTKVSIPTFIHEMTFLTLKVEMMNVLESLWTFGGFMSGIKFQRDYSHCNILIARQQVLLG